MDIRLIIMQQTIELKFVYLLFPLFVAAGFYGWRRGWREEAITTVGIILTLLLFANEQVSTRMAELLNRIVGAFGIFINALMGGDRVSNTPFITLENFRTFQIIALVLGFGAAYLVGGVIGKRRGLGRGGQGLGALVGILNAYIVLSKILDFIQERRDEVAFPLEQGAQVIVEPLPQTNELRTHLPTIFALLFLVLLVVTFFRLPKIRQ